MSSFEHISKGMELDTLAGYLIIGDYNGSIVNCECYTVNEEGEEENKNNMMYTLSELAGLSKEVDGRNHKYIYDTVL